jgi:hypothetical protein
MFTILIDGWGNIFFGGIVFFYHRGGIYKVTWSAGPNGKITSVFIIQ